MGAALFAGFGKGVVFVLPVRQPSNQIFNESVRHPPTIRCHTNKPLIHCAGADTVVEIWRQPERILLSFADCR